jgi:flagellar protein FlbD
MIQVTRLNDKGFIINCELIKFIESTPDTLITLSTGEKLMVKESVDAVVAATMEYRKRLYQEKPGPSPAKANIER